MDRHLTFLFVSAGALSFGGAATLGCHPFDDQAAEDVASSGGRDATGGNDAGPAVGGGSSAGGSASSGGGSGNTPDPIAAKACEEPVAWPVPTQEHSVGNGTAASCTESALREAMSSGGHVIFDCGPAPVTIALEQAIEVTSPTTVDGDDLVSLDAGGQSQIFIVAPNNSFSARHLRLINGQAPESMEADGIGGAISGQWRSRVEVIGCTFEDNTAARGGGAVAVWTGSSLTVVASRFVRNHSWYGGAIYSLLSPLSVINSEFVDNSNLPESGMGDGGAIGTDGASEYPDDAEGGAIEICGSAFRNNHGYGQGGGAYLWVYPPDTVLIDRSTIASNSVSENADGAAIGGGMRISNGAITVKRSTFESNESLANGGALYLDCAPDCSIQNSTFFGNHSEAYGGAIFGSGVSLDGVTFAENYAEGHGGALFGDAFTLHNSLFVDNESGNPWGQARNCSATFTGDRVLQWASQTNDGGGDTCVSNIVVADPKLSELGDHGGSTPTMPPMAGSGALDAGASCQPEDQREEPRGTDVCDLGAVEVSL